MHLTLEALNHILTVIAVTAFLYSRKNYFKDIIDSNLLPGKAQNKVHKLSEEIGGKIKEQIDKNRKTDLLGFEEEIYDLDNKEIQDLLKVKTAVESLKLQFTKNNFNILKQEQDNTVKITNRRFKNASFYIALVAFFYLILAAGYQHDDFTELRVFLTSFNILNILMLTFIFYKKSRLKNYWVIVFFFISVMVSMIPIFINGLSTIIHTYFAGSHFVRWLISITYSGSPLSFILLMTLLSLIMPWILCFFRFSLVYLTTSRKIRKEESPIIVQLNNYMIYINTSAQINCDPPTSETA